MAKLTIDSEILGRSYVVNLEDIKHISPYMQHELTVVGCEACRYNRHFNVISSPLPGVHVSAHTTRNCPHCLGRGFHEANRPGQLTCEEVLALVDRMEKLEDMVECARDAIEYGCLEDAEFALNGS